MPRPGKMGPTRGNYLQKEEKQADQVRKILLDTDTIRRDTTLTNSEKTPLAMTVSHFERANLSCMFTDFVFCQCIPNWQQGAYKCVCKCIDVLGR